MRVIPPPPALRIGVLLAAIGCRGGSGSPGDSADTTPVPVTWTAEQCSYSDPEFEEPTGTAVMYPRIPGCPVVAEEDWYFFASVEPFYEMVICQSDVTWEEARETGLLTALQIGDYVAPSVEFLNECEDVSTGQAVWFGPSPFFDDSGGYGDSSDGDIWWFAEQDGRIRSAYIEATGPVICADQALSARIVFGEPLFTPEARHFTCKQGT